LQQIVSEPDGVLNVLISTVLGMAYLLCNLCWCKWTERAGWLDYIVIVVSIVLLLSSVFTVLKTVFDILSLICKFSVQEMDL